jgi:hypothetical protein
LCGGGGGDAAVRAAAPDVSSLAGALGGGGGKGGGDNAAAAAAGEGGGKASLFKLFSSSPLVLFPQPPPCHSIFSFSLMKGYFPYISVASHPRSLFGAHDYLSTKCVFSGNRDLQLISE